MFGNFFAQFGGVGFEKIGVYDRFFLSFKKGVLAAVGVVDQVVRQDERAVFKAVVDADDRTISCATRPIMTEWKLFFRIRISQRNTFTKLIWSMKRRLICLLSMI